MDTPSESIKLLFEFSSHETGGWVLIEALIDTGSDYTLLPRKYAGLLGVDVAKVCVVETTLGVGGSESIYLLKKGIRIKFGKHEMGIPVGFLERDDVPCLIGRLKCLEKIGLEMKNLKTTLTF